MKSFKSVLKEGLVDAVPVDSISKEDLLDLIELLNPEDYEEVAELILDLSDAEDDGIKFDRDDENIDMGDREINNIGESELEEGVTGRFKNKDKSIRRFNKSAAQLKKDKIRNKIKNRKKRVKNKLYRRKNKIKIKKYQKTRNDAIRRGLHTVTKRRGAASK